MRFSLPSIKCSAGPPSFRRTAAEPRSVVWIVLSAEFDYHSLGSCRKLGGATEDLIDGREKRICQLSFEF